ncbi:APC family permease [Salinicola acroporae]|uniref:Amino acid transporter n=1 Tax=Salinicola acroporae TaxID=1541440 RepID=A0ABT6I8L0_9GAMM|nr:APC family permease [Salinicola acroporae]MDH4574060.1 amino acid transporter [Salinicola acroporae]
MDNTNPADPTRLHGSLGTGSIVFMVIAAAAPLTVIGGNAPIALASGNGAGAPVGFLIASLVMLIFSVGFVAMTPHVKEAGAFFSYVTLGLGRRLGLGTAFMALVAYTAIQAGVYGYMGWAVGDFVRHSGGPAIPWWIYSLLTVAIVAYLGYRHIELSAKVLGVALVLEIAVVVIMNLTILADGGAHGVEFSSFTPGTALTSGLGVAVLFALTGFIGFEATAVFRDEARQPARTIPRATYLAVLIIGVFYTLSVWALVVANGAGEVAGIAQKTLDGDANLLLDTAERYTGGVMRDLMQVLLLTSLFACVLSFHNVLARYQFTLARQGTLPRRLARIHPRHRAPSHASLVQTLTALTLMLLCLALGLDPLTQVFGYMAGIATVGMIGLMLLTTLASLAFFRRHPELAGQRRWQTRIAPSLAAVLLLASLALVLSNFTLVTGGSIGISALLALIPLIALLAGALFGRARVMAGEAPLSPPGPRAY